MTIIGSQNSEVFVLSKLLFHTPTRGGELRKYDLWTYCLNCLSETKENQCNVKRLMSIIGLHNIEIFVMCFTVK